MPNWNLIDAEKREIPYDILVRINQLDDLRRKKEYRCASNYTRFYIVIKTESGIQFDIVAVKTAPGPKQIKMVKIVARHPLHGDKCLVRDMTLTMGGYTVDWDRELNRGYYVFSGLPNEYSIGDAKIWMPSNVWIVNWDALADTKYKYLPEPKYDNIRTYMLLYEKTPKVELLIKAGFQSKIYYSKRILKKLESDKNFVKYLLKNRPYLCPRCANGNVLSYSINDVFYGYRNGVNVRDAVRMQYFCKRVHDFFATHMLEQYSDRILSYGRRIEWNYAAYMDYLAACGELGIALIDTKNLFPMDFRYWHDVRIDQRKTRQAEIDKIKDAELNQKIYSVAQKYIDLCMDSPDAEYAVRIATSKLDLIAEGDALHHCVGRMNYDQRMVDERSLIFFIRRRSEPDKPFVTVEFGLTDGNRGKVLQCYGIRDTGPDQQTFDFVYNLWQPFAAKNLKKLQMKESLNSQKL